MEAFHQIPPLGALENQGKKKKKECKSRGHGGQHENKVL
jgi:hypothetical protein